MRTYDVIDTRPVGRFIEAHAGASGYRAVPASTEEWDATYWDTQDWRLLRAGLQLRVRGRRADLMPRKTGDDPHGALASEPIKNTVDNLPQQAGPVAERVRVLIGNETLGPRFRIISECQAIKLVGRNGAAPVAILLETLTIPVGSSGPPARAARVHVDGRAGEAFDRLWDATTSACRMREVRGSRFGTALVALGIAPPEPLDIGPEVVAADGSVVDVAHGVLRRHFRHALRHEPGTRLGDDIEELHDMRVSVRRMRSVIKLFGDFLPEPMAALRPELGWLGRVLGDVRDLDVQIENLAGWRELLAEEDRPALDLVEDLLQKLRREARAEMLHHLDTDRYCRLVERTRALLSRPPRGPAAGLEPILRHAPLLIRRAWARVLRPGRKIGPESPQDAYHRLRIRCKALRYTLETHAPLYGAPAKKMIRRLVVLQDLLGEHQDAHVAVDRLREIGDRNVLPAQTVFALGTLAGYYRARAATLRRDFPAAFTALRGKRWKRLEHSMQKLACSTLRPTDAGERRWPDPGSRR